MHPHGMAWHVNPRDSSPLLSDERTNPNLGCLNSGGLYDYLSADPETVVLHLHPKGRSHPFSVSKPPSRLILRGHSILHNRSPLP